MIKNSSNTSTHDIVRNNLQEVFIAKRDEYPTTRSEATELLDKYDEKKPPNTVASEGTAFTQKGKKGQSTEKKGAGKKESEGDDDAPKKNFFENKECFICGKKGHGAKKCPEKKKKNDNDDLSVSSKSSKKSIEEFEKKLKNATNNSRN